MITMKKAFISALIPLMAIAPAAAQTAALHADGFKEEPRCNAPEIMNKTMAGAKKFPSGIKATSPRFDLELYTGIENGKPVSHSWTLIGDNRQGKLCILGASTITNFADEKWYATYFKAPQLAANTPAARPQ